MHASLFLDWTTVFSVDLALIDEHLGRLPHDSPELPPGDDIPDHAGHVEQVGVLLIHLQDDGAVLTVTLSSEKYFELSSAELN